MTLLRRLLFEALLPAFCLLGIAYNTLLAINGPEGMRVHKAVKVELAETKALLVAAKREKLLLEKRADLLSLKSMNRDLLDETSRRVLGLTAPGERIISSQELDRYLLELDAGQP